MTKLSEVLVDLAALKTLTYKPPKPKTKPITESANKGVDYKIVEIFSK